MASSFFKQKRLSCKTHTLFGKWFSCLQIVCPISKCPKIQQDKNLSNFDKVRCQNNGNLKICHFLQKLKKVVRIVLYGPAISQSDCRKAGPYQLSYKKRRYKKIKALRIKRTEQARNTPQLLSEVHPITCFL